MTLQFLIPHRPPRATWVRKRSGQDNARSPITAARINWTQLNRAS